MSNPTCPHCEQVLDKVDYVKLKNPVNNYCLLCGKLFKQEKN